MFLKSEFSLAYLPIVTSKNKFKATQYDDINFRFYFLRMVEC